MCVVCKGTKKMCGLSYCPVLSKINFQTKQKEEIKEYVFGPSNEIFVGSYGYPNVAIGPMVSSKDRAINGNELYGLSYEEIIQERLKLLRGKKNMFVTNRMENDMKEVALSIQSTDVEMNFSKKPYFNLQFSSVVEPMGASAPIKKYKVADNPKIPKKIDSVINDDISASQGLEELYFSGFDSYYATKVLSTGVLGKDERKRLVPTRWSITATDDILGKKLMDRIKDYPENNEILVFSNEFLYNHFEVLLLPGKWEFENFESWNPQSIWAKGAKEAIITEEYESYWGRTKYADKQVGGYYASRMGVLEYLNYSRKQARVVVFREIKEGYIVPVGVWEIRENVRNAFLSKGKTFSTVSEALDDISSRLSTPINKYRKMSRMLSQSRIHEFF